MIDDDLRNMQVTPGELHNRAPHTVVAGELLTRSDGATVRIMDDVRAVIVTPGPSAGHASTNGEDQGAG